MPPSKIAGNLRHFLESWKKITSDQYILSSIQGYKIEFVDGIPPKQGFVPSPLKFNGKEKQIIRAEIQKFLSKGVIEEASHSSGEFI